MLVIILLDEYECCLKLIVKCQSGGVRSSLWGDEVEFGWSVCSGRGLLETGSSRPAHTVIF